MIGALTGAAISRSRRSLTLQPFDFVTERYHVIFHALVGGVVLCGQDAVLLVSVENALVSLQSLARRSRSSVILLIVCVLLKTGVGGVPIR